MEAPLVPVRSGLKISLMRQPPRLVRWGFHPSLFRPLMIAITDTGSVCRVGFACGRTASAILKTWVKQWPQCEFNQDQAATAKIIRQIFSAPQALSVLMTGTDFQHQVWKELIKIPVGETISYAQLAQRIKNPKAVRAVGTACGANPVPILIPCHRVIASNGTLGGFAGGLPLKKRMLKAEGVQLI